MTSTFSNERECRSPTNRNKAKDLTAEWPPFSHSLDLDFDLLNEEDIASICQSAWNLLCWHRFSAIRLRSKCSFCSYQLDMSDI